LDTVYKSHTHITFYLSKNIYQLNTVMLLLTTLNDLEVYFMRNGISKLYGYSSGYICDVEFLVTFVSACSSIAMLYLELQASLSVFLKIKVEEITVLHEK